MFKGEQPQAISCSCICPLLFWMSSANLLSAPEQVAAAVGGGKTPEQCFNRWHAEATRAQQRHAQQGQHSNGEQPPPVSLSLALTFFSSSSSSSHLLSSSFFSLLMIVHQTRGHNGESSSPSFLPTTVIALPFLSRQDFSPFFPHRLIILIASNCTYIPMLLDLSLSHQQIFHFFFFIIIFGNNLTKTKKIDPLGDSKLSAALACSRVPPRLLAHWC